jgi:acyl-CoA synthetase (AMP-forming)/AMP-acid ligase II
MYQRLLQQAGGGNQDKDALAAPLCPQMRLFISGSAPLSGALHGAFESRLGISILERYGMTETLMVLSNPCSGIRKAGSVGKPLPGTSVRLVDDAGQATQPGEIGEIWVRGPAVFSGYWKLPEATQQAFEDGWFKTGDMARQDADGYYRIAGRRSVDILKTGGFKVSALEVEDALLALPGIGEAAVVGIPHSDRGEEIVAFVRPNSDTTVSPPSGRELGVNDLSALLGEDLEAHLAARLARYKHPSRYILLERFPRNAMGKVSKTELKRLSAPS